MSIGSSFGKPSGQSANQATYRESFRKHVFALILMGYRRLDAGAHRDSEEPVITEDLVRAIDDAMEDRAAPAWAAYYDVHENKPVNAAGRRGKRRPQVDFEFVRVTRGSRPRYQFEAKRLRDSASVGTYLGVEGLGRFLVGKYAREHHEAGMLGYVQADDERAWTGKIRDRLQGNPKTYRLRRDGKWRKFSVVGGLEHTYRTRHDRKAPLPPIAVCHVLLNFG